MGERQGLRQKGTGGLRDASEQGPRLTLKEGDSCALGSGRNSTHRLECTLKLDCPGAHSTQQSPHGRSRDLPPAATSRCQPGQGTASNWTQGWVLVTYCYVKTHSKTYGLKQPYAFLTSHWGQAFGTHLAGHFWLRPSVRPQSLSQPGLLPLEALASWEDTLLGSVFALQRAAAVDRWWEALVPHGPLYWGLGSTVPPDS